MNYRFCPTCGKQYESWEKDPCVEYRCGACGDFICIDGKHNYLYCSEECAKRETIIDKSKLHPGCECCIHSEERLQRALQAEAREYDLLQKLRTIREQMPSEFEKIFKDNFWEILA